MTELNFQPCLPLQVLCGRVNSLSLLPSMLSSMMWELSQHPQNSVVTTVKYDST